MEGRQSWLERVYTNGNTLKFAHLEYEKNKYDWQGSQITFIWFDEVTHFTAEQFRYLASRNRSTCWVKPYIRATCNPDPDSRVRELIDRWIDDDWFIIKERDGVVRYFTRDSGNMVWWDSKQEVKDKAPHLFEWVDNREELIKSFTFIEWDIYENKELLQKDPWYLANLMAQDEDEKKRLLEKNWNISNDNTCIFDHHKINDIFTNYPKETKKCISVDVARFWRDLAVVSTGTINHIKRMDIFTKSSISELHECIEQRREEYGIGSSDCIVDQDGVGWWLVDMWRYVWYSWGATALPDPTTKIKENYKNLKTQCQYRLAKYINENNYKIDMNFYVDWIKTDIVKIWWKTYNVDKLIKEDLRSVKRDKVDMDQKKQIIPKDKQKILLKWRSPDFWDSLMQTIYYDLQKRDLYFVM